jgi:hypothetical protein
MASRFDILKLIPDANNKSVKEAVSFGGYDAKDNLVVQDRLI